MIRCMRFPLSLLCALDHLVPHRTVHEDEDDIFGAAEAPRLLRWVCHLHDEVSVRAGER